jgi:cytochrome c oxidase subunit II
MYMQSPAGATIEAILWLYDFISFFLVIMFAFIAWFFIYIMIDFPDDKRNADEANLCEKENSYSKTSKIIHMGSLEVVWTLVPVLILTFIAVPSFNVLYAFDVVSDPEITIKAIGNQWYWSYEVAPQEVYLPEEMWLENYNVPNEGETHEEFIKYSKIEAQSCDSYMIDADELMLGSYRLLETDQFLQLPVGFTIRVIVTAGDVLHSFAIPALGVKIDAVPGRLNQTVLHVWVPGIYYGQCSELCGVGHGFMPIKLEFVEFNTQE